MSGSSASKPRIGATGVILLVAILLAGCARVAHVPAGGTVTLAVAEYRLDPSTVDVPAGQVTIVVRNLGRLTHDLVISRDGRVEASTKPIWPGASGELTVDLSPGTYSMASTILSDQDLGAYGTLNVRAS